jgi:hypothetical protein
MTKVLANLDKLIDYHKKHQQLQEQVVQLQTQLKLAEAIILLNRKPKPTSQDIEMANLIIDLSTN